MASSPENLSMAVFCDFENVALGVRDANYEKFDIKPILERLLLKGSIVVKKAYCDWDRYKSFKGTMHEANFELIEIPHVRQSGKNSADIRLVVDALDLCYTKAHVNTFVIISGDSDFSPLVSKLRENAKQVIGVGVKQSTSDLLVANCDEFIFYDDLVRESRRTAAKRDAREIPAAKRSPDEEVRRKEKYESRKTEAIEMAVATFDALVSERGDSGKIWASMLKEAIKRRKPDFSESYYGFRTFGNLLEEAQTRGLLEFGRDEKSGAYVYRSSGLVPVAAPVNGEAASEAIVTGETGAAAEEGNQREGGSRRDSRRNGRGGRKQNEQRRGESAPQAFVPVADAEAVVEQYAPAPQPEVQHEVAETAEAAVEVVAEEGNAKRGSRRNGRGGRKNGDGAREARAEVVEVEVASVVEAMPEPVVEAIVEAVAEAKPKAKPRTPARKAAAAKKPAKKAAEAVVETIEPAPVELAVVAEDKPAKAPRKTPARRPARKKAEAA
ncbi:NYN domain [Janthinobacterium lividum]|uniref:NYN domain-containing protein n=1 Tax=Janthinobacterium lividum TaxID=29581 RepID=UPI000DFDFDDE|nr:NYN domain-containing protein [Janthinobacterium lividum]STQ92669.1 NYN domain [Janthinobacterium lividum]